MYNAIQRRAKPKHNMHRILKFSPTHSDYANTLTNMGGSREGDEKASSIGSFGCFFNTGLPVYSDTG